MTVYQIYRLITTLFNIYQFLIVIWCLMSWLPLGRGGFVDDLRAAIGTLVEPYLGIFRRFIPPLGMMDISPIVAILALSLIERVVLSLLL